MEYSDYSFLLRIFCLDLSIMPPILTSCAACTDKIRALVKRARVIPVDLLNI